MIVFDRKNEQPLARSCPRFPQLEFFSAKILPNKPKIKLKISLLHIFKEKTDLAKKITVIALNFSESFF
jgi:hypothetical protein